MSASASDTCFKTGATDDPTNYEDKDTPPRHDEEVVGAVYDHGEHKLNRLGWRRLTVVMLVEAIALGCLSLPSTFATPGMLPGVLICVGMGFIVIYTSYVVGQVKIKFPQVAHYSDVGRLIMGRWYYEILKCYAFITTHSSRWLTLSEGDHRLHSYYSQSYLLAGFWSGIRYYIVGPCYTAKLH